MTTAQKPRPRLDPINKPYFAAALDGRLALQQCQSCHRWIFYPRVACPYCLSMSLLWKDVAGTGEIYSFAIVHRPQHESFMAEVPIILVAVKLNEGPIVISTLADCNPTDVHIGQKVVAVFEQVSDEIALPKFKGVSP